MEKKEYKNENLGEFDGDGLVISTEDLAEKMEQLEAHKVDAENEGVVIEGNVDGEGKPIQDERMRKRDDGAIIHRMSVGEKFKASNVKGCYKAFQKVQDKENADDLLFKHYHYSDKEIEVMHAEVDRLHRVLSTTPHDEVDSVFLNVRKFIEEHNIPPVECEIENSEN